MLMTDRKMSVDQMRESGDLEDTDNEDMWQVWQSRSCLKPASLTVVPTNV